MQFKAQGIAAVMQTLLTNYIGYVPILRDQSLMLRGLEDIVRWHGVFLVMNEGSEKNIKKSIRILLNLCTGHAANSLTAIAQSLYI